MRQHLLLPLRAGITVFPIILALLDAPKTKAQSFVLQKDIKEHLTKHMRSAEPLSHTTDEPLYYINGTTKINCQYLTVHDAVTGKVIYNNRQLHDIGLYCFYQNFSVIPRKYMVLKYYDKCTVLTYNPDIGSIYDALAISIRELLCLCDNFHIEDVSWNDPTLVALYTKALCRIYKENRKYLPEHDRNVYKNYK